MFTGAEPWRELAPMQIAMTVGVEGLRPVLPDACPADYAALICQCWSRDPAARPNFRDVKRALRDLREDAMKDEACVAAGGVPARRERSMTLGEIDALNARRRILREPRLASRDGDDSSLRVSLDEENIDEENCVDSLRLPDEENCVARASRGSAVARNRTRPSCDAVRRHP